MDREAGTPPPARLNRLNWRPPIAATSPTDALADGELRCAYHPDMPTRLRCSRCSKPICTRCVVTTAVGQRCRDCARVRPTVTYETNAAILARALGAGVVAAVALGAAWGLWIKAGLSPRSPYNWSFWFALLLGFGVAEAASWAANRKRGVNLQILAIGCVLLGVAVSRVLLNARQGDLRLDFLQLLFIGLACAIAWVRFR